MRVLVIITRMHARAGASDDEFGTTWDTSRREEPAPRGPIKVEVAQDRWVLVVDGCQFYDHPTETALTNAASVAVDSIAQSIPESSDADLVVLFHSQTLNVGTPVLRVRAELDGLIPPNRIAGLYRYTGGELKHPPLSLLQDVVSYQSTGQAARDAFDSSWSEYANASLNLALEVLEEAYTREGARAVLDRDERSEISLPREAAHALRYIAHDPSCETDADLLEGLKSLKQAFSATLNGSPTPSEIDESG